MGSRRAEHQSEAATPPGAVIRTLGFQGKDADLVRAVRAGDTNARAALYDRYANHVQRVLARVLGLDAELPDLIQEVFLRAFASIDKLNDPERLKAWLSSIAVFTARGCIRKRKQRKWLWFMPPEHMPEAECDPTVEESKALRCTYEVLERMPTDERMAFALRFIEGMELRDAAEACGVSLATIKRRVARAQKRFVREAKNIAVLSDWIERGARWSSP